MKPNALVFDLDDTIIDTRKRHYRVIIDFLKENDIKANIPYEEYLKIRRTNNSSNIELLKHLFFVGEEIENKFKTFWKQNIEKPHYLTFDEIIVDTELLNNISFHFDLFIISLRSNHQNAKNEVKSFSFYSLFNSIHFLQHQKNTNPKTIELLKLRQQYQNINFIGDSTLDKEAAYNASINFILVKTGIYEIEHEPSYLNVNNYLNSLNIE